ncbi:hypothetical protein R5K69_004600 [Salmonella enterica]|nr:hypothetical protein [Salmonella enterica]EBA6265857.1 hypothetical protein [Salmonella enterica]EBE1623906.1 hypothetical protein [Salmonella enterica]EBH4418495.1 hypothetical protein [Salmonella enterica]EIS4065995.1 hypothetical protein [Salmonella enterica]
MINGRQQPDTPPQTDYSTLTRQTERFIRECLERVENESETAPGEWLENARTAFEVWYSLAGKLEVDKVTLDMDCQRPDNDKAARTTHIQARYCTTGQLKNNLNPGVSLLRS